MTRLRVWEMFNEDDDECRPFGWKDYAIMALLAPVVVVLLPIGLIVAAISDKIAGMSNKEGD